LDIEHAVHVYKAATKMTYEEAGAADEEAFEIGKTIGIHLSVRHLDSTACPELTICAGGIQGLP
jgi:hypothetical protein